MSVLRTSPPADLTAPLTGFAAELHRASLLLRGRLGDLELRVRSGDEGAWPEFRETALAVAALEKELREALPPGLTTRQMAELVGVTPRTLLRRKRRGQIKPALQAGRLIRWSGSEAGGGR